MDQTQKAQSGTERFYKDLQPYFEWNEDEVSATLVLMLPGFTKEQLRVQVTSKGVLRINCERQGIENIWHRFGKEFPIPTYCDPNDVNAKFERGVLSIKFPKLITPANKPQEQEAITNPPQEASMPQQNSDEPKAPTQAQVVDEQRESPKKNTNEPISDEKEKNKVEEKDENEKNVRTNDESSEKKEVIETTEGLRKRQAKMTQRLKTRILDFNISLRSRDDNDVNQLGFGCVNTRTKRGKLLVNMIVASLLILVLGVYVKNAFWSSS
ncbi:uncharacterized protein LOC123923213 [Trifolium pratense]|uniref:uncharacterized protein LOC123923213 n=1 Tax=Trifolium pratense TaxID=57577 RepID=UPI001E69287F|nr:uncharacterized protein LOC123923213 [Trifolium pratense]